MLYSLQFHYFWWYHFFFYFGLYFEFCKYSIFSLSNLRLAGLPSLKAKCGKEKLKQRLVKKKTKKKTRQQKCSSTSHFTFCLPGLRMIWGWQNFCRQAFALSFKSSVLLLRPQHLSQMCNLDIKTAARDGLSTSTHAVSCTSDLISVLLFSQASSLVFCLYINMYRLDIYCLYLRHWRRTNHG